MGRSRGTNATRTVDPRSALVGNKLIFAPGSTSTDLAASGFRSARSVEIEQLPCRHAFRGLDPGIVAASTFLQRLSDQDMDGRDKPGHDFAAAPQYDWNTPSRLAAVHSPVSGQHNVSGDQEPKRVITYKRNIHEYCNDCEPRYNEGDHMYAENVEHR